jgi:hypothetical protein
MCKDTDFQNFVAEKCEFQQGVSTEFGEKETSVYVRDFIGVESRKELMDNKEAREKLRELIDQFSEWL